MNANAAAMPCSISDWPDEPLSDNDACFDDETFEAATERAYAVLTSPIPNIDFAEWCLDLWPFIAERYRSYGNDRQDAEIAFFDALLRRVIDSTATADD